MWQALTIAVLCVFIPISIEYFDRPIADFFAVHFVDIQGLGRFAALPGWLLLPALLVPLAALAFPRWRASNVMLAAIHVGISVTWTSAMVEIVLKRFFGRLNMNGWILHRAYEFRFFAGDNPEFRSFPSGEAAVLSAAICALWPFYPRLQPLLALLAIVEIFLLLSLNWHFLSDVVGGAVVGMIGAIAARQLMNWEAIAAMPRGTND
jgi:undecaprenyl-diphosphatase